LTNTRARLRQLYGDAHRFDLRDGAEGGAVAEIRIPFQSGEATQTKRPV